jgi:hypothetical protein
MFCHRKSLFVKKEFIGKTEGQGRGDRTIWRSGDEEIAGIAAIARDRRHRFSQARDKLHVFRTSSDVV